MTYFIIYLIGVLLAYVLGRIADRYCNAEHSWNTVIQTAVFSIGSLITVMGIAYFFAMEYANKIRSNTKPPKWL